MYTNSTSATLSLSADDNVGVTGYYISDSFTAPSASDAGWVSVASTPNYSDTVSYTLSSGDGSKTLYAWYKDASGNVSYESSDSITLETTAPTISITSPTASSTYDTTSNSISLGGNASDDISGVSGVTWSNSTGGSGSVDGTTSWTISNIGLSAGDNTITVTATDGAGNTVTDSIDVTYTDNTNPSDIDITTGLVGHWTFDDGTATDNSGNGNDGTINGANQTTGIIGNALSFDGIDDHVTVDDSASWDFAGKNITVSVWFNVGVTDNEQILLEHFTGGTPGAGWYFHVDNYPNKISFIHRSTSGGDDNIDLMNATDLRDNQWHHAVVTMDGTMAKLFIDGTEVDSDAYGPLEDHDQLLYIGSMNNTSRWINGSIDEIRIYDQALSEADVMELYEYQTNTDTLAK
ncbi:MAG: hypothetical protein E3K37_18210 [Candidatus Kuenenia sp.]|nr:hypothetical protein [Candidatus Kuenenia hertensis]